MTFGEKVEGNTITVIEGNKNDAVGRRKLQVNGRYIRGYGLPKYDAKVTNTSTAPSKPQTNTSNALGTYMITASDLKVRTGPIQLINELSFINVINSLINGGITRLNA